ncbi:hypothetical protein [Streptacidiphilus griseoplanus]|uniref:hypothetical protein n=1 Tax=Peterkaempfera griseoplana TaxID=66896 RepID=UPI000B1C6822|nr:hypothetical protein [Peterkaempfera griseoplana]
MSTTLTPGAAVAAPAAPGTTRDAPRVIGLDVSLSSTGVAGPGWTDVIRPGNRTGHDRLAYQLRAIADHTSRCDFVVIEGPAFSRALQRGHDELAAARWMVRHDLWRRNIPYAVCPPDNRTIYATGKARWKGLSGAQVKGLVRAAVEERYGVECSGRGRSDRADAYVLMAMGRDRLGYPLSPGPATHRRALAGVAWPLAVPARGVTR